MHELGHFFAARRAGIFVEEFALGMGPKLWSTKGEYVPGEVYKTAYSIRLLPIGGFCKMLGEDENYPDEPRALNNKKVHKRMFVMAAGALMNFLLAFIIFFAVNLVSGFNAASVRSVMEGSPAERAGLVAGDEITHINGGRVWIYEDFAFEMMFADGSPVDLTVNRGGQKINIHVTPLRDEAGQYKLGFYPQAQVGLMEEVPQGYLRVNLVDSVTTAFGRIVFNIKMTAVGIYRLVTGNAGGMEFSGMIGIAGEVGNVYEDTIEHGVFSTVVTMLNLCALISANLGIFNLFPLPALDGGRLVFLAYEAVRRKPFPPEREGAVHFVGFVLLMILAVFIAYQDIMKLLG